MSTTATLSNTTHATPLKWQLWLGRGISAFVVFGLLMSASMKLAGKPETIEMFTTHLGYQASLLPILAGLELLSVALYLIPQTAVLGAIIMVGYLGGAVATHVRIGEAPTAPIVLGVLAWVGLYLRDARIRKLLPLRSL